MVDERIAPVRLPRKLLMTADAVGGVWQYSLDLARALNSKGIEVLLAVMGPSPSKEQLSDVCSLPSTEVAWRDFALEWMPSPWRDVDRAGGWLLDVAEFFQPDLIHLNGYSLAVLPWEAPVAVVAHSCVFSWWRAVRGFEPGDEWAEYKRRITAALHSAGAIVAPSRFMAQAIRSEYDVPLQKISVIYNFSSAAPGESVEKEPFILAAGRFWDQAKNLQLLESVADKTSWPVCVAGKDRESSGRSSLYTLGALHHEDLLRQMNEAAIFAHPARYEPFGLAVLEAAQRACCLVLADVPSLRELWEGAAVFIDPNDTDAWAGELNRLAADSGERSSLGRAARARSIRFNENTTVNGYSDVYSKLLDQRCEAA